MASPFSLDKGGVGREEYAKLIAQNMKRYNGDRDRAVRAANVAGGFGNSTAQRYLHGSGGAKKAAGGGGGGGHKTKSDKTKTGSTAQPARGPTTEPGFQPNMTTPTSAPGFLPTVSPTSVENPTRSPTSQPGFMPPIGGPTSQPSDLPVMSTPTSAPGFYPPPPPPAGYPPPGFSPTGSLPPGFLSPHGGGPQPGGPSPGSGSLLRRPQQRQFFDQTDPSLNWLSPMGT